MPHDRTNRAKQQLDLFRPRPKRPQWSDLPLDTRRKTLPLLAALLRPPHPKRKEADDER